MAVFDFIGLHRQRFFSWLLFNLAHTDTTLCIFFSLKTKQKSNTEVQTPLKTFQPQ